MLIKFIYNQAEARKHVFKWLEPLIGGARGTDSGWYVVSSAANAMQ